MLRIDYESEGFAAAGPVRNGLGTLEVSWNELLSAAVTVGRPNRACVFRHGVASVYEAVFRLSLVRMAIEQAGVTDHRLRLTDAARTLDTSEKGAVSYFLGMTICKLFAKKLLDTPWLLHLDVFGSQLGAILRKRSRPDLVGQSRGGQWVAFESKGRLSPPGGKAKTGAKQQARQCVRVNNVPVAFHIGGIAYFKNEILRFFWRDPEPHSEEIRNGFSLTVPEDIWSHYYSPALAVVRSDRERYETLLRGPVERVLREPVLVPVQGADLEVGIDPRVIRLLAQEKWAEAKRWCVEHARALHESETQPDGIRVVAGQSWSKPFEIFEGANA